MLQENIILRTFPRSNAVFELDRNSSISDAPRSGNTVTHDRLQPRPENALEVVAPGMVGPDESLETQYKVGI